MINQGSAKVDASITDSPFSPKGKTTYEVASDRKEDERKDEDRQKEEDHQVSLKKKYPGVDSEARWLKKAGKLHYGFKKHIATDDEGMVEALNTTTANEHDCKGLKSVIKKVPKAKKTALFGDKGFKEPDNDTLLGKKK
jgi:transposase, IS5 family